MFFYEDLNIIFAEAKYRDNDMAKFIPYRNNLTSISFTGTV